MENRQSSKELERAFLRTVVYSSLFEYPLTWRELLDNLQERESDQLTLKRLYRCSPSLRSVIQERDGFLFLRTHGGTIEKRRKRQAWSKELLESRRSVLKLIGALPYTRLVALSGSAAHLNVDRDGDIDLFIITRGRRVWMAALSILLLTKLLGCRKSICFNFILSDRCQTIDSADLFSANQIVHLKPISGRESFEDFLDANPFVRAFYPNFRFGSYPEDFDPSRWARRAKTALEWLLLPGPSQLLEWMCRRLYSGYLRRKSGRWLSPEEVILGKDNLKLHTQSHRRRVLQRFRELYEESRREMNTMESAERSVPTRASGHPRH